MEGSYITSPAATAGGGRASSLAVYPREEERLHITCRAAGQHPASYRPVLLGPEHLTPSIPAGTEVSMVMAGVGGDTRGMKGRLLR